MIYKQINSLGIAQAALGLLFIAGIEVEFSTSMDSEICNNYFEGDFYSLLLT